jgi:hypothetical protein
MLRDRAQEREIFEYAKQLHKLPMEERLEAAQHIARRNVT